MKAADLIKMKQETQGRLTNEQAGLGQVNTQIEKKQREMAADVKTELAKLPQFTSDLKVEVHKVETDPLICVTQKGLTLRVEDSAGTVERADNWKLADLVNIVNVCVNMLVNEGLA
jgi:maltodextrin utilization protein YvdJ